MATESATTSAGQLTRHIVLHGDMSERDGERDFYPEGHARHEERRICALLYRLHNHGSGALAVVPR